jgi:hypothetical protein
VRKTRLLRKNILFLEVILDAIEPEKRGEGVPFVENGCMLSERSGGTLMSKHRSWDQPAASLTNDKYCPECERAGVKQPKACKKHSWKYKLWWKNFLHSMAM